MSWDKNTINYSNLDAVKKTLDTLKVPYKLSKIGDFKGRGLNDDPCMDGTVRMYELRRLEFKKSVILEYVDLDADCDVDDSIYSQDFTLKSEPKDWVAVRYTDIFNDHPDWEGGP